MRSFQLALLILATGLAACGSGAPAETAAEAVDMFVIRPVEAQVAEPVIATGTIAAAKSTDVGPSVDGIIEEVMVKVGDRVQQGDVLFRTRDVDYKLNFEQATQNVALAKARRDNAYAAFQRQKRLAGKGIAPEGRLDDAETAFAVAEAQWKVAEAQAASAAQLLADCIVYAPFSGVITRRDVDPGRFMATRMGGMGGPQGGGGGVVQLMDISIVAAIVFVPESQLAGLRLGAKARVAIDGTGKSYDSEVHVINDRVDPATRMIELRLAMANPDFEIKPGLFARAEIEPKSRMALTLDRRAIAGASGTRYVYVLRGEVAARVAVESRDLDAARVEILSGLTAGDLVLTGPNTGRLYEGAKVRVVEPEARTAQTQG